jgi:hypothetical protein
LQFSARGGFRVDGEVIGRLGQADIWVYAPSGDSYIYLYLVTNTWALVNLELSAVGVVSVEFDGTFSYSAPSYNGNSLPSYKLSTNHAHVLRYNDRGSGNWLTVNCTTNNGITATGTFSFNAHAFAVGQFALITIFPSSWSTGSGFAGEGLITFTIPYDNLKNALYLHELGTVSVNSVQTTVHATSIAANNDNEYHYVGTYFDSDTSAWGVRVYRSRFTSTDTYNLVHIWILALFY